MSTSTGWVIVDVETTGTDPHTCRMLSIAALALAPDGTILDTMSTLLNPGVTFFELSCRTGQGFPAWAGWLRQQMEHHS